MLPSINLDNRSRVVTDAEVRKMVLAANLWLPKVAQAYGVVCRAVRFRQPEPRCWQFLIVDEDKEAEDALAFHSEEAGVVTGYVLAKTILDNGGVKLYKDKHTPTVSSALAHELAEALIDPDCNQWVQNTDGSFLFAREVCDPVQSNIVPIVLPDRSTVGMSDFVLPSWFDPQARMGPFNWGVSLRQPFQLDHGGYVVRLDPSTGQVDYVFGERVPEWVKAQKLATAKCRRRTCRNKPPAPALPAPVAAVE